MHRLTEWMDQSISVKTSVDEPLLLSARKGDPRAFQQLYERQAPVVFRVAIGLLGNRLDAEDVTQEVFVTLYKRLKTFEFRSSFETWCYRITVNACHDKMRKQQRRAAYQAGYLDDQERVQEWVGADLQPEPIQSLFLQDVQRYIARALARLHPDLRTALVLKDIEELSYHEIAAIMSCSQGTVASRLARARQQVAKYLRRAGVDATYLDSTNL